MKTLTISQLAPADIALVNAAREATNLSYSPYSHFHVGAAILLENGKTIKGANQENSAYPVGICAERSTIATAHNMFPNTPIKTIALAATNEEGVLTDKIITPCGMCRQVIAECELRFHKPIKIIMTSSNKIIIADKLEELLPMAFS